MAGKGFTALDASRTWIVYWITHGLALLGDPLEGDDARKCVAFLARCQDASGGFGGGPGQLPHLAPTYATVSALLTPSPPRTPGGSRSASPREPPLPRPPSGAAPYSF